MDRKSFIDAIKPGALNGKEKGVLPSLTMAQAILESGWGRNAPGYNMFGIKWSPGCGHGIQLLWTKEWDGKKYISVKAKFRKYSSYTESIEDHTELLQARRYEPVRRAKDYKEACKQIKACGYATSPTYTENLIKVIEENELYKFDEIEGEEDFDIMTYTLKPIARGKITTTTLGCKPEPSNKPDNNGTLRQGNIFNIYAKSFNEGLEWYLVNINPKCIQWIAAKHVQII